MNTDHQNDSSSIQPPEWASRYAFPPTAAYWLDQFARRSRGDGIRILNPADIARLRKFRDSMVDEKKAIFVAPIKAVLLYEYHFSDENAQCCAEEIMKGEVFNELDKWEDDRNELI